MISGQDLKNLLPRQPARQLPISIAAPKIASGKVREIYDLNEALLLVATDRISAFDVVLPGGIPGRGMILTQLSRFWLDRTKDIIQNQIPENEDALLNESIGDVPNARLRSTVVKKLKPLPIECVARGYLAGSGWTSYQKTREVCGVSLADGLQLASQLPEPIFTPTTKAAEGHDLPINDKEAAALVGKELYERVRKVSLELYHFGHEFAKKSGIILADTKFEFGLDDNDELYLIDEALTPDSSRYWEMATWTPGENPASFDKQIIRDYLDGLDWDKTAPGPELPAKIIERAQARYLEVYDRLTNVA